MRYGVALVIGCLASLLAAPVFAQSTPVAEVRATTPSMALSLRQEIIQKISGGTAIMPPLMSTHAGDCCGADAANYFGRLPATSNWLGWHWGFGGAPEGMVARTYFATFSNSSCLLVYNAGHGQGFFSTTPDEDFSPTPTRDFIRRVVNEMGCDVALSSMPITGENASFQSYIGYTGGDLHAALAMPEHAPPIGTPLRYFIEPAIGTMNYALSLRSYDKVIVSGLSGGGWTTTLLAAIDVRITHSYAIAGSVPLAYRNGAEGDWEQLAGIRQIGVDYPDLYLMGTIDAAGAPTRHVGLLYNGNDSCCFKGPVATAFASWLKPYAAVNGFGPLRIFVDPVQSVHAIHSSHVDAIIQDALNAGL